MGWQPRARASGLFPGGIEIGDQARHFFQGREVVVHVGVHQAVQQVGVDTVEAFGQLRVGLVVQGALKIAQQALGLDDGDALGGEVMPLHGRGALSQEAEHALVGEQEQLPRAGGHDLVMLILLRVTAHVSSLNWWTCSVGRVGSR